VSRSNARATTPKLYAIEMSAAIATASSIITKRVASVIVAGWGAIVASAIDSGNRAKAVANRRTC
jgi:hypothetical protein